VLVVEDEPRLRDVLLRAIPDMGFEVAAVARGEDALAVFRDTPPDIVMLDLNLPDMEGLELFERAGKSWPTTQFVILTGFGTVQAARKAIRLDVVDFLTKPASLNEIDMALDRARRRCMGARELPEDAPQPKGSESAHVETLHDVERAKILEVLQRHDGNRAATAQELGISLRKLYYRLAEYHRRGRDF